MHTPGRDVRGVAFSRDGLTVASNSFTGTTIFHALTGKRIAELNSGVKNGWGVEFSPDGRTVAVTGWDEAAGGQDIAISIWETTTHQPIRTLRQANGFKLLTFSPDGTLLAATEDKNDVTIFDVKTGKVLKALSGHPGGGHRPAFSPDGRYLAVACGGVITENQGCVKIWDVAAGRLVRALEGHTKIVWGVGYTPDGQRLASASFDQKVKIWDATTGQEVLTLHGHTNTALAVAFSRDGRRLATAGEDGTIRIWNATPITDPPAREIFTLTGHTDVVRAVAYSPDGRWIASAGDDATVWLWNAASGRSARQFRGHHHPISGLAFRPDGRSIVSVDHHGTMLVWDVETGSLVLELRKEIDEEQLLMEVAYSPDGLTFATVGGDSVNVFDSNTGKLVVTASIHDWMTICLSYTHDGRRVATGSRDSVINVIDTSTGKLAKTVKVKASRVSVVSFSPDDGHLAAVISDGSIKIWDTTSWADPDTIRAQRPRPGTRVQP